MWEELGYLISIAYCPFFFHFILNRAISSKWGLSRHHQTICKQNVTVSPVVSQVQFMVIITVEQMRIFGDYLGLIFHMSPLKTYVVGTHYKQF